MPNQTKKISTLVLLAVPLLALTFVGCGKKHNDNIQDHSPDNLPLRLQLPKDGSTESFRILQYAPDDLTKQMQMSVLTKGRYEGGRQIKLFRDDNSLREIRTYWEASGDAPAQLGYDATFDSQGHYLRELTLSDGGVRQTEGSRLPDGTFEQNLFYSDGKSVYKHGIFGQVMIKDPQLEWKPFSAEVYRDDKTLAAAVQRMDDGGTLTQFYDAQHCLVETLHVDKDDKNPIQTDYQKDCKTPKVTYDISNKIAWTFDEKGLLATRRKWYSDYSQQYTVYKAGVPLYMQDWEVDAGKSDKNAAPPRTVLYLFYIREFFPDESVSREIHFYTGTTTVEKIEIAEAPPKGAKFKKPNGPPSLGSTTPAKNWTPPPPTPKPAPTPTPAAAAAGGVAAPSGQAGTPSTTATPAAPSGTPSTTAAPAAPSGTPSTKAAPAAPAGTPSTTAAPAAPSGTPSTKAAPAAPSGTPSTKAAPAAPSGTPSTTATPATTPTPSLTPTTPSLAPSLGSHLPPFMAQRFGFNLFSLWGSFFGFNSMAPSTSTTTTATPSEFWTPSGAHVTYNYSKTGNLTSIEYYKKGETKASKTEKHKESEHIRPRLSAPLVKELPAGNPPPEKPVDLTPTAPSYDKIDYDYD